MTLGPREKVVDDRDRRVPILSTSKLGGTPRGTSAAAKALLAQLREIDVSEARSKTMEIGPVQAVVLVLGTFTGLGLAIYLQNTSPNWPKDALLNKLAFIGVMATVAGFVAFVARLMGLSFMTGSNKRIVKAFIFHALCPSCGTSLASLRVESDGCVSCSQCNAAWRVDRFGPAEKRVSASREA